MHDFLVFRTVSGPYDVPLDDPKPRFGQQRRKKSTPPLLLYQGLKPDSYQTPPARTLVTTLVPERVRRVRRSPGLPRLGIHQPDPWVRAGPAGTAPPAHPQLSDQARQKRKARTGVRTRGPIVFPSYPPTPIRNPLDSQELNAG